MCNYSIYSLNNTHNSQKLVVKEPQASPPTLSSRAETCPWGRQTAGSACLALVTRSPADTLHHHN